MPTKNRDYQFLLLGITLVLALPLLAHMINGLNVRMVSDDYCFASFTKERGWQGTMSYLYTSWQGTFSATAVLGVVDWTVSTFLQILPAIMIVGWWLALIYLIGQLGKLAGSKASRSGIVALATLIMYALVEGTPSVYQSIYWVTGSVTYTLPMVLFTLLSAAMIQVCRQQFSASNVGALAVVLGIGSGLAAGFSPIFAVYELGVITLILLAIWYTRPPQLRTTTVIWGAAFIGAMVGTIILVAAPGNAVRQAEFHKPSGIMQLISLNIAATASYIAVDLSHFSVIPNLVVLVLGGWLVSREFIFTGPYYARVNRHSRKWLAICLALALLLLFGIFLPTTYNISGFPPGRALIIPHFVLVSLILASGSIMATTIQKPTASGVVRKLSPITIVMVVGVLIVGPLLATSKTLSTIPKLNQFSGEWDQRNTAIRNAIMNGQSALTVKPFTVDLADYMNEPITEGYILDCAKSFYSLKDITVSS